jgi:nucleoside phosphorylase
VEHVILVGCAGGVPHYSDYTKHPRRGDIIVSFPDSDNQLADPNQEEFVYAHFELEKTQTVNRIISRSWMPASMDLYKIVNNIKKTYNPRLNKIYPWENYLEEGIKALYNEELDCRRPAEDKLFFTVGDRNVIEVNHPEDPNGLSDRRQFGQPTLRFGRIGGGERVVKDESLRHTLSEQYGILCFDSDIDQVMESIHGNRKDSFLIIRSIVDYVDGTSTKEWQPYASLCAAAFMKTVICALPPARSNN